MFTFENTADRRFYYFFFFLPHVSWKYTKLRRRNNRARLSENIIVLMIANYTKTTDNVRYVNYQ